MWVNMDPLERGNQGELGTDQAIIEGKHFFIKGRLEIPVIDSEESFAWLVWVEVSMDDFLHMSRLWTTEGREKEAPYYDGQLANNLGLYSESTLGSQVRLHTRPVGQRPLIETIADHQLRSEQQRGISSHVVQEIADKLLYKSQ
jgi:hypothetical protein